MNLTTIDFGCVPNGLKAKLFQIVCDNGMRVGITNYGGIITTIETPDRSGKLEAIAAGFDALEDYLLPNPYFGALIGRYAGRIAYGQFSLEGVQYQLSLQDEFCHLHGGDGGFHTRLWDYQITENPQQITIALTYLSPHLEEGYPGNLKVKATYKIFPENRIELEFEAFTDQSTFLNLTNHSYFNLNGFANNVSDHQIKVTAKEYVELNDNLLPTGKLLPVVGSPLDFQEFVLMSDRNIPADFELDHCFVLQKDKNPLLPDVELRHEKSGRSLKIFTSQPGVQVYSGNFLDGSLQGHGERKYFKHSAICFETQHFADSMNHPSFPSTLLKPHEKFFQTTVYQFGVFS